MRIETKTIHSGYHAEGPDSPVTPTLANEYNLDTSGGWI